MFIDNNKSKRLDVINNNREVIFLKIVEYIQYYSGNIVTVFTFTSKIEQYFQNIGQKSQEIFDNHPKENQIKQTHNYETIKEYIQTAIIDVLKPVFEEGFDKILQDFDVGSEYKEKIKPLIRIYFLFNVKKYIFCQYWDKENFWEQLKSWYYTNHQLGQKKSFDSQYGQLPKDHKLINMINYQEMLLPIIPKIGQKIQEYIQKFNIDKDDKFGQQLFIEKYFVYILIDFLIDNKIIFDLDGIEKYKLLEIYIDQVKEYIQKKINSNIDTIDTKTVRKKMINNLYDNSNVWDITYENSCIEDICKWEEYLDTYFFAKKGTSLNNIRIQILQEYNKGKTVIGKTFELINPLYDFFQEKEQQLQKIREILSIISIDQNQINNINQYIEEEMQYIQQQKPKYRVFEKYIGQTPSGIYSFSEIEAKYLKKYQIPKQYWRIFSVIITKNNLYYRLQNEVYKHTNKINTDMFQWLQSSEKTSQDIMYFLENYITIEQYKKIFSKKWEQKQQKKTQSIINKLVQNTKKIPSKRKKSNNTDHNQYSLF